MFDQGFELYKDFLRTKKELSENKKSEYWKLKHSAARKEWLNFKFWNKCLAAEIEMGWE